MAVSAVVAVTVTVVAATDKLPAVVAVRVVKAAGPVAVAGTRAAAAQRRLGLVAAVASSQETTPCSDVVEAVVVLEATAAWLCRMAWFVPSSSQRDPGC